MATKAKITGARAAEATFIEGKGSAIESLDITSNKTDKTISLANGVMVFLYYESILQDSVRALVYYSDSANTIV